MEKALAGFERVRIDLGEAPAQRERFKVEGIPVIVVVAPDGRELARHMGYQSPEELLALLTSIPAPGPAPAAAPAPR